MRPKNVRSTPVQVVEKYWLNPNLVRLVLAGDGNVPLTDFAMNDFADAYVKLVLAPRGVNLPWPWDVENIKATRPAPEWPVMRSYTVRAFDGERLTVDFVVHDGEGVAGPWAREVEPFGPGSQALLRGPGGAYAPDPDADRHLLVGDTSALPAIAVALERLPLGARADVVIQVEDSTEEMELVSDADVRLRWVHAACSALPFGEELVTAVKAIDLQPEDDVHAFVHGEAGWVKELRSYLRFDCAIPRERLSISGYWRRGATDEQWRKAKAEWNAEVEATERRAS